ncbi:hypothetical protein FHS19_001707 [Paenibacillus rhizosphaerae]|uniref:Glycoside hydrolase family 42 N-terminal domain-containing protein n=1 Tax=Paenibacillus rhizosphaerae TaxID=297318 RepID=A0A839TKK5_9BACL|nr:beta-galactosidase [Paenibacillus rhizosphaerae]MBB3127053.1 hypothetical protein [Paenibacillus rhizosphaerae]
MIIFYDQTFPYGGVRPDEASLQKLASFGEIVGVEELAGRLDRAEPAETMVWLHGPYFPKASWSVIVRFLERGCGFVHIGGSPFRIPVYSSENGWIEEREQPAYHQRLRIHEIQRVEREQDWCYSGSGKIYPLFEGMEVLFEPAETCSFVLTLSSTPDHPREPGSSGPMDARIHPVMIANDKNGREKAAPAVLMENVRGTYAGSRWLFINQEIRHRFWISGGPEAVARWAQFCGRGVTEAWLKTGYASYEVGENPALLLQMQALIDSAIADWNVEITVSQASATEDSVIHKERLVLSVEREIIYEWLPLKMTLEPGLYRMEARAVSSNGERMHLSQGFWCKDNNLLTQGESLACGRDYFMRNGKPMPVVGMTYMASDTGRKFLFLPNPDVWDRDMEKMKRAGINLIRTGIWSAWRHIMLEDGHPSDKVLRSMDAFLLTAARHGLEVIFTFFAFTPEMWEGSNPYLDTRSVEAQKRFIRSIVTRHANTTNVHWDLINEPSLFDPSRIFDGPRKVGDVSERVAFRNWLRKRHGNDIRGLQEKWGMTPEELPDFESANPPEKAEINFNPTEGKAKRGLRWLDYCLFTMDMHNRWVGELSNSIRSSSPKQLITVGQDEAVMAQRPSPFFYADSVDYTSVHTWWLNDHLLWDGLVGKTPLKPNLVQETGMMYVETASGMAKRSEPELRNMLERKYAYAFAAGAAGAVQWIWNINPYLNSVNESNIGALRADGTEKPEVGVSYGFGQFMGEIHGVFADRRLEEVAVIFPYSNSFSNRHFAFDATTRLSRVLSYQLKQTFRIWSEYHLSPEETGSGAKLMIVPSAHNLSSHALEQLLQRVRKDGSTLLLTGPLSLDEYWKSSGRLQMITGDTRLVNVCREEMLEVGGDKLSIAFGQNRIGELVKEIPVGIFDGMNKLHEYDLGKGKLLWCPLPVECSDSPEAMTHVYRYVLDLAGVTKELRWIRGGELPGVYGRKLAFPDGALYIFVSESGYDAEIAVQDADTGVDYSFVLERDRSVLFAADRNGDLLAVYRPEEVKIWHGIKC